MTVSYPGGPVFIGSSTQFEARETLGNGTTRVAPSAAWTSDRPQVASVSGVGLVSAAAAGEASISADVNGVRGSLPIRVLPSFGGDWAGTESGVNCVESGALAGFCAGSGIVGAAFFHESSFVQNLSSVTGVLHVDVGVRATMTGAVTTDGELQLPGAQVLPPDPEVDLRVENWRSRADTPSRMTGTYDIVVTVPGVSGSARVTIRLDNVVKTASGSSATRAGAPGSRIRSKIRSFSVRTSAPRRRD